MHLVIVIDSKNNGVSVSGEDCHITVTLRVAAKRVEPLEFNSLHAATPRSRVRISKTELEKGDLASPCCYENYSPACSQHALRFASVRLRPPKQTKRNHDKPAPSSILPVQPGWKTSWLCPLWWKSAGRE